MALFLRNKFINCLFAILISGNALAQWYTVQPFDTLSEIAQRHGLRIIEIANYNEKITNLDYIQAYQKIFLPKNYYPTIKNTGISVYDGLSKFYYKNNRSYPKKTEEYRKDVAIRNKLKNENYELRKSAKEKDRAVAVERAKAKKYQEIIKDKNMDLKFTNIDIKRKEGEIQTQWIMITSLATVSLVLLLLLMKSKKGKPKNKVAKAAKRE